MSSLVLDDVHVKYGRAEVVRGFSDTIRSGEWLGLIGPNGAGKSSLLKAMLGVVPSTGDVVFDGASITLRSRARRAALLAYVPQDPVIPADMTGRWSPTSSSDSN